ncbi:hypothetical protein EC991_003276 [Linnemannia zychae]|nr:hypothetical protein EC991_003276 [Linnemannia zychae]
MKHQTLMLRRKKTEDIMFSEDDDDDDNRFEASATDELEAIINTKGHKEDENYVELDISTAYASVNDAF